MKISKNDVMKLVNNHRNEIGKLSKRLAQIDSRWKEEEQSKARAQIWNEHKETIDGLEKQLRRYKTELSRQRQAEQDPMRGLFRAGFQQADKMSPGLQVLLNSLDIFNTDTLMGLVQEYQHPQLTLQAWQVLKDRDIEGHEWEQIQIQLFNTAHGFIDAEKVRESAEMEKVLTESEIYQMDTLDPQRDPTKKLNLGYEIREYERAIENPTRSKIVGHVEPEESEEAA